MSFLIFDNQQIYNHYNVMYKVGCMMMGRPAEVSPKKVKEVILEVQAKTKITNIYEYLLQLNKINSMNVSVALEKNGQYINDTSTISQVLKYTRPVNGVIKLYLYESGQAETSMSKMVLKPSRHEVNNPEAYNKVVEEAQKNKESIRKSERQKQKQVKEGAEEEGKSSGFCCC